MRAGGLRPVSLPDIDKLKLPTPRGGPMEKDDASAFILRRRLRTELLAARLENDLTQQRVADAMDWSMSKMNRIEKANGGANALLMGVIESVPFQKCRKTPAATASLPTRESIASNSHNP